MLKNFRQRLEVAFSTHFQLLRRIPSTTVWRTLGYIGALSDSERVATFDTCAGLAVRDIEQRWRNLSPASAPAGDAAYPTAQTLYLEIFSHPSIWTHFPNRFMYQYSDDLLAQMVDSQRVVKIRQTEPPTVAKAGPIRKVLCERLNAEFGCEPINHGGGEWSFTGIVGRTEFLFNIDFGVRGGGFRYDVAFPPLTSVARIGCGVTLESTYGFPTGVCDYPISDELDSLANTLCDTINDIATLRTLTHTPNA